MTTKTDVTEAVMIERTFNAPVARVWKALTDADEMRVWYFDLKEFKPEVGFEFEFTVEHEGTKYHHLVWRHFRSFPHTPRQTSRRGGPRLLVHH